MGGCFSDGEGSLFLSGRGGGVPHGEASVLVGGFEKYRKMGRCLLHSDRKNCRVDKYLRAYQKTVL